MFESPLVTVVIPTHNRPDKLRLAVRSVLEQTYQNIEIIIVDDHSEKETERVGLELSEHSKVFYFQQKGYGACSARNYGFQLAKGEFVTGLDDDDMFTPRRIEKLLGAYDDQYSFVASRADKFNEHFTPDLDEEHGKVRIFSVKKMLDKNRIGNQVFTRRERLLSVGGFDEKLRARQDYDLWVRLAVRYGSAKIITNKLYLRNDSLSYDRISTSKNRRRGVLQFYKKHRHRMSYLQRISALALISRMKILRLNFFSLQWLAWKGRV